MLEWVQVHAAVKLGHLCNTMSTDFQAVLPVLASMVICLLTAFLLIALLIFKQTCNSNRERCRGYICLIYHPDFRLISEVSQIVKSGLTYFPDCPNGDTFYRVKFNYKRIATIGS